MSNQLSFVPKYLVYLWLWGILISLVTNLWEFVFYFIVILNMKTKGLTGVLFVSISPGVSTNGVSLEATGAASISEACESPGAATLKVGTLISNCWHKTFFWAARRKMAKDNTLAVDFMFIPQNSHTYKKTVQIFNLFEIYCSSDTFRWVALIGDDMCCCLSRK